MHIVIVNAHWNNRGDEAAHRALWEELVRIYPGCRVTVLVKDKKSVEQFPKIPGFTARASQFKAPVWQIWACALSRGIISTNSVLTDTIRTLKSADLIIYPPGGAVISDRFFWSKQVEYLTPFLCARLYRIPMVVAAPSMGPFDAAKPRRIRSWLLRAPAALCVREDISRQYLAGIGIVENVHVTMDLAFMNEVDAAANQIKLEKDAPLYKFLASHEKVVGVTISDFKWHVKLGKDAGLSARIDDTFRRMIATLAADGYGVLLIPQLFGNQNDMDHLRTFLDGKHSFLMDENHDTYVQQHVIGQLHSVIGMRYHSNIFAAKMGVPFVAVAYEEKMQGFLDLAGLAEFAIPVEEISFDKLLAKFRRMEAEYGEIRTKLADGLPKWRERARLTVDHLATCRTPTNPNPLTP